MSNASRITEIKEDARFTPAPENREGRRLTQEQIRAYNERGYLCGLPVFDPQAAFENREAFERLFQAAQARGMDGYSINGFHGRCRTIYDLVTNPIILDYVGDLLGPNILCWGSHFFCKLPGDVKEVAFHQDAPYWPLEPLHTVTVWLAIDDVDDENSAMQVFPGTHLGGPLAMRHSEPGEGNVLYLSLAGREGLGEPVTLALKAGSISLHADLLVHGSRPNTSTRRRCGLAIRYASTDVRATRRGWNKNAILCRGVDADGHWRLVSSRPEDDSTLLDPPKVVPPAPNQETARMVMERARTHIQSDPERASQVQAIIKFVLSGEGGGTFTLRLMQDPVLLEADEPAQSTMKMSASDFVCMVRRTISTDDLYYSGRLLIEGDVGLTIRLWTVADLLWAP